MYEWSRVIFAKKSKFHNAGGPDTVVSPYTQDRIATALVCACVLLEINSIATAGKKKAGTVNNGIINIVCDNRQ